MAKFNKAVITKRGDNEIARAVSNLDTITFTRIGISSTVYDYSTLKNLTKIEEVCSIPINNVTKKDTNYVNITAILTNENLQNGYYIETLGLFAKNKAGEEYLYSITTAEVSDFIPADRNITKSKIYIDFVSYVGSSQNVDVKTDMQGVLFREDIENVVYKNDIANVVYKNDIANVAYKSDIANVVYKNDIANVVYKSEVDDIAEKYIQRNANKNLLVNSSFLSTVTKGSQSFAQAGIYKFMDMFFGYTQNAQHTKYVVNFSGYRFPVLTIHNSENKTGKSYIMTYFMSPQKLRGNKGTLSFLIRTEIRNAKITVSIIENEKITEQSFTVLTQYQKIELTTNFVHKNENNVVIDDLVYIKITLSDENNSVMAGELFHITQLQYEVGEKSTQYIAKSKIQENNEVEDYIFPIAKGVRRLIPETSTLAYLPIYGLKSNRKMCYINNLFAETVDYKMYDLRFGSYYTKNLDSHFVQSTKSYLNDGSVYLQFEKIIDGRYAILPERLILDVTTTNAYISYYHNEN